MCNGIQLKCDIFIFISGLESIYSITNLNSLEGSHKTVIPSSSFVWIKTHETIPYIFELKVWVLGTDILSSIRNRNLCTQSKEKMVCVVRDLWKIIIIH